MWATITAIIPLITKFVERWIKSKETTQDRKFELEKLQAQADSEFSMEECRARVDIIKSENDVEIERLKTLQSLHSEKSGYKWIDASINLVRALFGYCAVIIFIMSMVNLWHRGELLLTQDQFSNCFFGVVFYFFAERSVKKAFENKVE